MIKLWLELRNLLLKTSRILSSAFSLYKNWSLNGHQWSNPAIFSYTSFSWLCLPWNIFIWAIYFSAFFSNLSNHHFFTSWQILLILGQFGERIWIYNQEALDTSRPGQKTTDQSSGILGCSLILGANATKKVSNTKSCSQITFWRLFLNCLK